MPHNTQKKMAIINDYSGFGRCSVTVELPIISAMKIQCCPLPTSIFSNHTGYDSFFFSDFTDSMPAYMEEWKKLDLRFEGICTGFLGSARQISIVEDFFKNFKSDNTTVIVDPVMGDHGRMYSTYTEEICDKMKSLVKYADIITPNLTEACILTDTPYNPHYKTKDLEKIAAKLSAMGPSKIVITGIVQGSFIANFCYEEGLNSYILKTMSVGSQRAGTGDIFSSIIAADAVNGVDFHTSVKKASRFIKKCIEKAIELNIPTEDGVPFEELLSKLR